MPGTLISHNQTERVAWFGQAYNIVDIGQTVSGVSMPHEGLYYKDYVASP